MRVGDVEAFGILYRRYARAALSYARTLSRDSALAEDLRAEAFSRTLCSLINGRGPRVSLAPYLFTVIRNVSADWSKRDRLTHFVGDLADLPVPDRDGEPYFNAVEYSMAVKAFNALPESWRTVLWHSLVDEQGRSRVAGRLGIAAPAAASLAYRAREGLRQAYLQNHITRVSEHCRPFADRLGAYTRNGLGSRLHSQVRGHLRECGACSELAEMLRSINAGLRTGKAHRTTRGTTRTRAPAGSDTEFPRTRSKSFMPSLRSQSIRTTEATARAVPAGRTAGCLPQLTVQLPAGPLYRAQDGRRRRGVTVRDHQSMDSAVTEVRMLVEVTDEQRLDRVDGGRRPRSLRGRRPGLVPLLPAAVRPARDAKQSTEP